MSVQAQYRDYSAELVKRLGLDITPIALAFADAAPSGVPTSDQVVPSACAFWRAAERAVFFAPAAEHYNCPVGSMVMGFDLPKEVSEQLMATVGKMTACGYIDPAEPAKIPVNKKGAKGIVYGPLERFPVAADAVLLWLTPLQAMLWSEAAGGMEWGGKAPTTVFGRPGCAAIPTALSDRRPSLSFGCIGMRTFTGIPSDRMLAVISGGDLAAFVDALHRVKGANDTMQAAYEGHKAQILGGPAH
jgi:uncharacterized protein (DUF169 family)